MKCYLVVNEQENKIMKVQDEDMASFKEKFGSKVLIEADSIQELLIKLSENLTSDEGAGLETTLFR
jgi:hypothetical protein